MIINKKKFNNDESFNNELDLNSLKLKCKYTKKLIELYGDNYDILTKQEKKELKQLKKLLINYQSPFLIIGTSNGGKKYYYGSNKMD